MSFARLIPGYGAALAAEARARSAPFVRLPPRALCGVEVRPLTLRDHERLAFLRSPFLCGGAPDRADVAQLLWHQRARVDPDESEAAFAARFDALDLVKMAGEIGAMVDEAMMDAPTGNASTAPTVGLATGIIHRLRSAYGGVSRDDVLDTELRELFGSLRCITRDADPGGVFFNPLSDPLKSAYAASLTAAAVAGQQPSSPAA